MTKRSKVAKPDLFSPPAPDLFDPPAAPPSGRTTHRLEGLEPDNLLAFLALLGLLRALETARPQWHPRAHWTGLPLRPVLTLAEAAPQAQVAEAAAEGCAALAADYEFGGREKLDYTGAELRALQENLLAVGDEDAIRKTYVFAALLNEGCPHPTKAKREEGHLQRSPLNCLDVAQVKFLKNLTVATAPDANASGRFEGALFAPWTRSDDFVTFRFDHNEYRKHAYMFKAPTKEKTRTQAGAVRLAAFGLAVIPGAAAEGAGKVRFSVGGCGHEPKQDDTLSWPIWTRPASLCSIRALLTHPEVIKPEPSRDILARLGVQEVRRSMRESKTEYATFLRAEAL